MPAPLPRTVLLDLDGTLVDNFEAIHRCANDVMRIMGLPERSFDEVKKSVGGAAKATMTRLVGEANAPTAIRLYLEHFPSVMFEGLRVYPGACELLPALRSRGIKVAVLTNKDHTNSLKLLAHLGMDRDLDGIFGTNVVPWRKPEAAFTHHALSRLGMPADSACLVGDSPFDIETARNAKLATAHAVTTGSHTADELAPHAPDTLHAGLPELAREVWGLAL